MAAISDIPHLIQLLDDESEEVRAHVWEELQSFGSHLEQQVVPLLDKLDQPLHMLLEGYFAQKRWERFQAEWWAWLEIEEDEEALLFAIDHLCELDKPLGSPRLTDWLGNWKKAYLKENSQVDLHQLLFFVFGANRLQPPDSDRKDSNSCHLIRVMEDGKGRQLALSLITVFLGRSLGLELTPYQYRSNYLILGRTEQGLNIFDPYQKGKPISPYQLESEQYPLRLSGRTLWSQQPSLTELVMRLLNQLIQGYAMEEQIQKAQRYQSIKDQLVALLSKDRGI